MSSLGRLRKCLFCVPAGSNSIRTSIAGSTLHSISTSSRLFSDDETKTEEQMILKEENKAKITKVIATLSIAEENERIRQLLLDRDGGSASVPTREGKWDQEMGRETSKQMHRVLDQVRVSKPGTSTSIGESESRHRFK